MLFLSYMSFLTWLGGLVILIILFQFIPKRIGKMNFILISAFALTLPFSLMILFNFQVFGGAIYMLMFTLIAAILYGFFGLAYYNHFRQKR